MEDKLKNRGEEKLWGQFVTNIGRILNDNHHGKGMSRDFKDREGPLCAKQQTVDICCH